MRLLLLKYIIIYLATWILLLSQIYMLRKPVLIPLGIPLENYMVVMSEKIVSADEDENIRHTFMAFDTKCKYRLKLMGVLNTNISNGMDTWTLK